MLSQSYINEYNNNNKSGKMSSDKYVSSNFTEDYNLILKYCIDNNIDLPFKQKVYHTINNIPNIVVCENEKCKNPVKFKNSTIGYIKYCCKKCVGSDPNIKKKKVETNLSKFGVQHASLNKEVKDKIKKIYDDRTDQYKNEILNKRIKTVNDKYGVSNISQLEETQKKRIESFKENIDKWKINYKKTSLERYGVSHPWEKDDIHNKTIVSSLEKRIELYTKKILEKLPPNYNLIEVINRMDVNNRLTSKVRCHKCENIFEINNSLLYDRTIRNITEICTLCNPISKGTSGLEIQLLSFISNNYSGEIINNIRSLISPYEIDIYLPDLKLAFEFNGLYWHSEINKDKNYHYKKTKMCSDIDIQLIHIWEDDWVHKGDIIKSMILNKLNKSFNRIYARKCEVKEVTDNRLVREFLNNNHIQGFVGSNIKLGLYYEDELVSLMTFGKLRQSMGYSPNEVDFELIRFCNKLNTNVIGGASKLFKYFINQYKFRSIISYSDNSYSNGGLYETLGFNLKEGIMKLNYYWVIDDKRNHRYNFRKSNLLKMGYDPNKSEKEIMYEDVGGYRIWGSGNKKWEFGLE